MTDETRDETRKEVRLGPLEIAVLDRLWDAECGLDVAEMQRTVGDPRGLKRNTIHSTLERLVRKGLAIRSRRGRAYEYAATGTRTEWIGAVLDSVVEALAPVEPNDVVVGLVDFAERASPETLEALEALVRDRIRQRTSAGTNPGDEESEGES